MYKPLISRRQVNQVSKQTTKSPSQLPLADFGSAHRPRQTANQQNSRGRTTTAPSANVNFGMCQSRSHAVSIATVLRSLRCPTEQRGTAESSISQSKHTRNTHQSNYSKTASFSTHTFTTESLLCILNKYKIYIIYIDILPLLHHSAICWI